MKLRDLFVPRWRHSNPHIRREAVGTMTNTTRLKQIAEHDSDPLVRAAALSLFNQLTTRQVRVVEQQ